MKFPDVKQYQDYSSYFGDFLAVNRLNDKGFSLRTFASAIGWPHALLRDLAQGAKRLSVLRALEFSKLANFDLFDTDWLVHLALGDNEEVMIRTYFKKQLQKKSMGPAQRDEHKNAVVLRDARCLAVYCLLASGRKRPAAKELMDALYTFDIDESTVTAIIDSLIDDGLIEEKHGEISVADREIFFREDPNPEDSRSIAAVELHQQFAGSLMKFLGQMQRPRLIVGGYALLDDERFKDLREKGMMWVRSLENCSAELFNAPTEQGCLYDGDRKMFQYGLVLFPLVDARGNGDKNAME